MLARIEQHPYLRRRQSGLNTHEDSIAPAACVVLFRLSVPGRPRIVQYELRMRFFSRRLSVEIGTRSARLNPEVHISALRSCSHTVRANRRGPGL
jgi:hypothetical protein